MRFSIPRTSVAAVAAAVALAACGGQSLTPSSSLPGSAPNMVAMRPDSAGPCGEKQTKGWLFGGSCFSTALTKTGSSGTLKAYKGITITAQLGTNNLKKTTIILFRDATGKGDITPIPPSKAFPLFGPKACAKGGSPCTGKTFIYIEGENTGGTFNLNSSPGIKITNTGKYPGTECLLSELTPTGWKVEPLSGRVSGKTLTFASLPAPQTIPSGAFFITFACSGG
jgi:hypothetical protein